MRIIDKLEVYRLVDQTCLASSTYFWARRRWFPRCTTCSLGTWPRLLDHTASFLRLEFFVLCLKDPQRFDARLTIGKYGQLHGTLTLIMAFTCRPSPYWLFSFFCISSSPFSSVALTVAVLLKYLWNFLFNLKYYVSRSYHITNISYCEIWEAFSSDRPLGFSTGFLAKFSVILYYIILYYIIIMYV